MINRRQILALPILAVPFLIPREVIVPKGIRFLGKYSKEVYYEPNKYRKINPEEYNKAYIDYVRNHPFSYPGRSDDIDYTPAPLSVYATVIEEQRELGYKTWELI